MRNLPSLLAVGLFVVCAVRCEAQAHAQSTAPEKPKFTQAEVKEARAITFVESTLVDRDENLKGISQVDLVIESLPAVLRGIVSKDDIQTAVELRCRSLGLRITDAPYPNPTLYININGISDANDTTAYDISVELHETVLLERDMGTSVVATVWNERYLAYAGRLRLNAVEVKADVLSLVDKFLNAWMKANGK